MKKVHIKSCPVCWKAFETFHAETRHCTRSCANVSRPYKTPQHLRLARCRLRRIWQGMRRRCYDQTEKTYSNYGGRGIKIYEAWGDFEKFFTWAVSTGYEGHLSIDRIKGDRDYSPENCRWATLWDQLRNTSQNRMITAWGETKCSVDWAADPRCIVTRQALIFRLDRGFTPEEAMTMPPAPGRKYLPWKNLPYQKQA